MNLNELWQRYLKWFSARNLRERVILAVAIVAGTANLGYTIAVEPALLRTSQMQKTLATLPGETAALQAQVALLNAQVKDPDAVLRVDLAKIEAEYAQQSERFAGVERGLISPAQMTAVLEQLLKRSRGLELIGLRSLPPASVLADDKADDKKPTTGATAAPTPPVTSPAGAPALPRLYRHGLEVRVAGSFPDLLAYLQTLEREAPNLIMGRLDLKAETYPRSVMTLTVHTLSMEVPWLSL